ncbi:MAG TPA: hypothetical protein PKC89_13210 [Pyrinomonadaceae bacterium]|nr:hypothetical protein [Pyrinomonadaceae bacterium]
MEKGEILKRVCEALLFGDPSRASVIATQEYAHENLAFAGRKYNEYESTTIFLRDGFLDRYSGSKLVFPASLRLISHLMPAEFPAHPNWKMSESHMVYWELFPTIDHVVPVARGGADDQTNWVTTSMIRNSAKSNWLLEELGWNLQPPGNVREWDGLTRWFMQYIEQEPTYLNDPYLKRWHRAAFRALAAI